MKTEAMNESSRQTATLLRRAMRGNAVFSGVSGLVLLFGARPLASFMGLDWPLALAILGGILAGYAAFLFAVTAADPVDTRWGTTAVVLDVLWVAGSALILIAGWPPLSVAGKWTVALLAEIVALFAIVQTVGLRRQQ